MEGRQAGRQEAASKRAGQGKDVPTDITGNKKNGNSIRNVACVWNITTVRTRNALTDRKKKKNKEKRRKNF